MNAQTWHDLTDAQITAIRRRTWHRYRTPLGRHIAAVIADRTAARLLAGRDEEWLAAEQERDVHRFQAENWDRVRVATEGEKDEVLRWLNDNEPDMLRLAMDEAES